MTARRPLVAGNWKMNTLVAEGVVLAAAIRQRCTNFDGVDVLVLPPFPHLPAVQQALSGGPVRLGAQDMFWEAAGAFTGEVSPLVVAELCDAVLVGHSERRRLFGETDEMVQRKLVAALRAGLDVILAVGETEDERDGGREIAVVQNQLNIALGGRDPADSARCVIAYEPVWAIGTGRTASPEDAQRMCAAIREHLGVLFTTAAASRVRVLYGGSMTAANAGELLAQTDIDGGLIGGASLQAESFAAIVAAAQSGRT